ncbi:ABC transporter substrate-binding protein [Thalassomonas viridans]|uniref:ABC transporter substrate-binding protein n=1 Tax=Thalassomonas viridans TaxID=137584 RepID=A0AAF0CA92_9GAMM|nr:ABC transporter substrate-binding protein [Thalassomonas viridans]WDE06060.1 ABC transporter substrate-binding protein [Thalassomonas viridans]
MYYLYLFILPLLFLPHANAGSTDTIRLATYLEPPMVDKVNNRYVGKNIEVVKLLAKNLKKKILFIPCPAARCLLLLKRGQADMMISVRKTPERERYLSFISPPFFTQHFPLRFFINSNNDLHIDNYQDLTPLSIGVIRGSSYFDRFDHDNQLTKVEVSSREQLVHMLLKNRIDTFIEREESVVSWLPESQYKKAFRLANYQYDRSVDSYIAIAKRSPLQQELPQLSATLARLVDTGVIGKILDKEDK